MLNEFTYCPRLMHREWVDRVFVNGADTIDGRFVHRRVDGERGDPAVATNGAAYVAARCVTLSALQGAPLTPPEEWLVPQIEVLRTEAYGE
jgi:CRISPR-associated protein Cas1